MAHLVGLVGKPKQCHVLRKCWLQLQYKTTGRRFKYPHNLAMEVRVSSLYLAALMPDVIAICVDSHTGSSIVTDVAYDIFTS